MSVVIIPKKSARMDPEYQVGYSNLERDRFSDPKSPPPALLESHH